MASFPSSVFTTQAQVNSVSVVSADDVNITYDELAAIETELGTNPSNRAAAWGTGSFSVASQNFDTVNSRIANVENGVYVVNNNYVSKAGGSQVVPTTAATVGLQIQGQTSQSANLVEFKTPAGAVVTAVNSAGHIATIDGGSA
jgi:hypothetical protein